MRAGAASLALLRIDPAFGKLTGANQQELWYSQPAKRWLEALPLGNGRLGAMVFGGAASERIALSESTAWSGEPGTSEVNPGARTHLAEIRQLMFTGNYSEANRLCRRYLLPHSRNFGTNLPLPEILLDFKGIEDAASYRRSLDLDRAIAEIGFRNGNKVFRRSMFTSHADNVLVVHLGCNQPRSIGFLLSLNPNNLPCTIEASDNNTLILRGRAVEKKHSDGQTGVSFEIHIKALAEDGKLYPQNDGLEIKGATSATLLVAIGTSFAGGDPSAICRKALDASARRSLADLMSRHLADYQPLYRRVSLSLGGAELAPSARPTDVRRRDLENGASDPGLVALFFQYGRYLTIAGSRADSPLPLALQGIWNDGLASSMGWTDDFHLDINTQQNYWPAEVCNLSECQTPLFGLVDLLRQRGRTTATEMYGARGWVAHTVTNPWGYTAPGGGQGWGLYVTAGVWIALQLWEHYRFTGDIEFLRTRAYPVFQQAAEFFLDYMVAEPKHGWLVTGPSDSPENWYRTPDGKNAAESMGPTVDRVFVYELLTICMESSTLLNTDSELRERWSEARSKLPPLQIGRYGQLQEWLEDFEEVSPNHRHTSHLTSLYPEDQISPRRTPDLAHAAEVTIQRRVSAPNWEQTEWGRANFAAFYARLLKGDMAHRYLIELIAKAADDNLLTFSAAGVAGASQNIFAIDGNTAGTAALAEMLLQSQGPEMELLPALPSAWPQGSIRGLCARGGYSVDIEWRGSSLVSARIHCRYSGQLKLRYRHAVREFSLHAGQVLPIDSSSFTGSRSES